MSTDKTSIDRFKIMERKLFFGIMTPGGIFATGFGVAMLMANPVLMKLGSFHAKLALILVLWVFHIYCGKLLMTFKKDQNTKSHKFYRWVNEIPTVILFAVVILIVVKPF
jgi:putative membrane protein